METRDNIKDKIIFIIKTEEISKAIDKISGYLECFYEDQWILNQLAKLHYENANPAMAGRFWFFKEGKSELEDKCVEEYRKSRGNDLIQMARELIGHNYKSPRDLNPYTKRQLFELLEEIKAAHGFIPKFAGNWHRHLKKVIEKG